MEPSDYTDDALFDGEVVIRQRKNGYRFTVDPVILAHFVSPPTPGSRVLDLGTGCGIIPLILDYRFPGLDITGIEIQSALSAIAADNIRRNRLNGSISVYNEDMTATSDCIEPVSFDMVLSNPPYTKEGAGRLNPESEKAIARHEIHVRLGQVVETAARFLKTGAVFYTICPVNRLEELLEVMRRHRLFPDRIRKVVTIAGKPPIRVLVSAVKDDVTVELIHHEYLTIYGESETYSPEMEKMFAKNE